MALYLRCPVRIHGMAFNYAQGQLTKYSYSVKMFVLSTSELHTLLCPKRVLQNLGKSIKYAAPSKMTTAFFKYNQQDATLYNILYYCRCSTCFRRFLRPSSGAQNFTHSIWHMSSLLAGTASGSGKQPLPSTHFSLHCTYRWAQS
jgi:hypothetical protein